MSCTSPAAFAAFEAKERGRAEKYTATWVGAAAAQDVVQDGLLVVWQKWDTLTNPSGYLYRTCRQLAFGEYEDRSRGPALLAELPEQSHLGDEDQHEPTTGAAMQNLMVELTNQNWSSPHTVVVGLNLAEGHSKGEVAQFLGLPLTEVHRAARELRRYYNARDVDSGPVGPQNTYTPHGLVMQAMRRLSRREQQVMALAALGLKPSLIAPLIGISGGSARTTLCHARKSVTDATEFVLDEGISETIDHFVRDCLEAAELLRMLPDAPWKTDALRQASTTFRSSRLSSGFVAIEMEAAGVKAGTIYGMEVGEVNGVRWGRGINTAPPRRIVAYLTEISNVINAAREGLRAPELIGAYGSVRWTHPGLRFRPVDYELRMYAAAFRRLQTTDAPYLDEFDLIPPGNKTTATSSAYSCPVPSWPAKPPRYLTLVSLRELLVSLVDPPIMTPGMLRARRKQRKKALEELRLRDRSGLVAAA